MLLALAAALAASLALWVRSAGFVSMPAVALVLAWIAVRSSDGTRLLAAQFLGVMLALAELPRTLAYLFIERISDGSTAGLRSDIAGVADALGGDHRLWGALVAAANLIVVAIALLVTLRRRRATSSTKSARARTR